MNLEFKFDDAVMTYVICDHVIDHFSNHLRIFNDELVINYTSKTDVITGQCGHSEIVIIGYCIDSHKKIERKKIPEFLADSEADNIEAIFRKTRRFAGRFMVLYHRNDTIAAWGDACSLLPVNYGNINGKIYLASLDELIGQECGLPYSSRAVAIRNMADYTQSLPNDMTMFEHVYALLPNHFLNLKTMEPHRVSLNVPVFNRRIQNQVIEKSIHLLKNICTTFKNDYKIMCPVTAGMDSRTILAVLLEESRHQPCYTFIHGNFTDQTSDLTVPSAYCEDLNLQHDKIPDIVPPTEYRLEAAKVLGDYFSDRTLSLAYTFLSHYKGSILLQSDILDQIGKSSICKNIPDWLARPSFFTCKIHNFSPYIMPEMKKMLKDYKTSGETHSAHDLFGIEQDIARWSSLSSSIYSVCGLTALNPCNCGELIDLWLSVPRRLRMQCWIHKEILRRLQPDLLKYPVNPGEKYSRIKRNSFLMWIGTYIHYGIQKIEYNSNNK